jgi:hypothetical protein
MPTARAGAGPTTPGKPISGGNAAKHGLSAGFRVFTNENRREFGELIPDCHRAFAPGAARQAVRDPVLRNKPNSSVSLAAPDPVLRNEPNSGVSRDANSGPGAVTHVAGAAASGIKPGSAGPGIARIGLPVTILPRSRRNTRDGYTVFSSPKRNTERGPPHRMQPGSATVLDGMMDSPEYR